MLFLTCSCFGFLSFSFPVLYPPYFSNSSKNLVKDKQRKKNQKIIKKQNIYVKCLSNKSSQRAGAHSIYTVDRSPVHHWANRVTCARMHARTLDGAAWGNPCRHKQKSRQPGGLQTADTAIIDPELKFLRGSSWNKMHSNIQQWLPNSKPWVSINSVR